VQARLEKRDIGADTGESASAFAAGASPISSLVDSKTNGRGEMRQRNVQKSCGAKRDDERGVSEERRM
jgi:hypothetical protein